MTTSTSLLPVVFLTHGAGPAWFLDSRKEAMWDLKDLDMHSKSADVMKNFRTIAGLPRNPRAMLVISAHWEETEHAVLTSPRHSLYFDYYGFPKYTYKLEYPAAGEPSVAKRVVQLLASNGMKCREDAKRGIDHGVFIPLILAYPEADVPVLQVSMKNNLDIADHMRLGEALKPLRGEDVLIIGSGFSTHRDGVPAKDRLRFLSWFHDTLTNKTYSPEKRKQLLLDSKSEPTFPFGHERIDHFLPSVVACAAASYQPGVVLYEDSEMSHVRFD